jgi:hypothetical protein
MEDKNIPEDLDNEEIIDDESDDSDDSDSSELEELKKELEKERALKEKFKMRYKRSQKK